MVLPFEAHLMPSFKMRRGIIPALYAERQSDLDGVGELLAVQADRRALVLCPREALALSDETQDPETDPCRGCRGYTNEGGDNCGSVRGPGIDLVVIIPPPEARTCEACHGAGRRWKRSSPDERWTDYPEVCSECHGSGRIEPWSIQPDWVRGIAEQCRAAGVPVADLTSDAPSALPEWLT